MLIFVCFLGLVFSRKKRKSLLYIDAFFSRAIVYNETLHNATWFSPSKQNRCFTNIFIIIELKYIHDSLNIVVILAPDRELLFAKCAQFPLTFTERN